ncbi:MAG: hypothetical protein IJY31_08020 [Muribaculaceae bacterium]|nr:hypothetical protein [Muribaculaceae bacterium]
MKTASDNISSWINRLGCSVKSIAKIILQSGLPTIKPAALPGESIIIMGNGPSLSGTIDSFPEILATHPLLAVNFAANAPEFHSLRPRYYVLADPYFFNGDGNPNVQRLKLNLEKVSWGMTLFVPVKMRRHVAGLTNPNLSVEYFNPTGVEGFEWLENFAYSHGLGMPRPRNVLIPSIMIAMSLGFRNIYITGADHSWTRTLSVNERNEVVSIQPHFYKDDEKEETRVRTEYLNYPLHSIIYSFYIAFKSYFTIQRYARHRGVNIRNATPGSFIDAFERCSLSELQ